jgi:hypothetical protein
MATWLKRAVGADAVRGADRQVRDTVEVILAEHRSPR